MLPDGLQPLPPLAQPLVKCLDDHLCHPIISDIGFTSCSKLTYCLPIKESLVGSVVSPIWVCCPGKHRTETYKKAFVRIAVFHELLLLACFVECSWRWSSMR